MLCLRLPLLAFAVLASSGSLVLAAGLGDFRIGSEAVSRLTTRSRQLAATTPARPAQSSAL